MESKYRKAVKQENDCWLSEEAQELGKEAEYYLQQALEPTWKKVGRVVGSVFCSESLIKGLSGMACMGGLLPVLYQRSEDKTDTQY